MGYSATAKAMEVIEKITEKCLNETGSQNVWKHKGKFYMFEIGRENMDGAVTGQIFLLLTNNASFKRAKAIKKGGFKINPDGSINYGSYGIFENL